MMKFGFGCGGLLVHLFRKENAMLKLVAVTSALHDGIEGC